MKRKYQTNVIATPNQIENYILPLRMSLYKVTHLDSFERYDLTSLCDFFDTCWSLSLLKNNQYVAATIKITIDSMRLAISQWTENEVVLVIDLERVVSVFNECERMIRMTPIHMIIKAAAHCDKRNGRSV